ncbi:MAG: hypothetical protein V7726_04550 [Pseudoalteromonas distincta]|uniref:hypothetical protein n=1 Tax=Pseudoalteromonas distincta TaxID=77608 RepID=UPI003001BB9A|tara:strand:+ start:3999 stop:4979 length:981 start_codon:yes stop_codon:yes gene_type:complete
MAETINIAEAAAQISEEIFSVFKWERQELFDQNLGCQIQEHDKKTHPCDCVFYYIDPYLGKYVYLNTDLKSYAAGTINKNSVLIALKSLALATHCANISDEWEAKYVEPSDHFDHVIRGFLFVYNHDNSYTNDFHEQLDGINSASLKIAKDQQVHVFGPEQIKDCYAIACDFQILKGKNQIIDYGFWYPDMIQHKVKHGDTWEQPATIELLSSPLIIIKYKNLKDEESYVIYYKRNGDTIDEFVYLIDLLSHYQILSEALPVNLRFISSNISKNVKTNFKHGVNRYMQDWSLDEAREKQLNLIKAELVTRQSAHYNIGDLGWRDKL